MDVATEAEKNLCIKLFGLLASLLRGRAPQLVKAVEDSNGFDAWRSLSQALKPTSKARGLALLGSSHSVAIIFNEQCTATSTFDT